MGAQAFPSQAGLSPQEAYEIVKEAYVFAWPLMISDITLLTQSNFAEPTGVPGQAPINQLAHARQFPDANFKVIVRANVDTLYSAGWLDLGPEPIVLSVPAIDRYFMLPVLSLWTDVFVVPGTRTTGPNSARNFLLVGPRWQGEGPRDLDVVRSPTRFAGVAGRTRTDGVADYAAVHQIQDGYKVTPLSSWGKGNYVPPKGKVDPKVDMKTPPPEQVNRMDAGNYFARFAELLKDNPPNATDYPMIHRLQRVGFRVGQSFDLGTAPSEIKQAFERGTADGQDKVVSLGRAAAGEGSKGWKLSTTGGNYGVNYEERAAVAYYAIFENLPQDAVYPSTSTDSDGQSLDGSNRYVIRFDKGKLPPIGAGAFWSVTGYDRQGYFIPNTLNRYALGDRDKLVADPDGSVSLYVQADSPGSGKEANWLPVAKGTFTLLMRVYSPRSDVLDRIWTPPPVKRV